MANRFSLDIPDVFYQPARPIDAFFKAKDDAAEKREKQRRWDLEHEAKLASDAQFARQNDIAMRSQDIRDAEFRDKRQMDIADRNRKIATELGGLVSQGRFGEADTMAAASQYIDPRTGQMTTPTFDRGAPAVAETSTPDYAGAMKALPLWGSVQESINSQPGLEDVGKPVVTPGRAAVNPSLTMADGSRHEFAPEERNAYAQAQADKRREGIMAILAGNPNLSPQARQTLELQAGLTGAQASGQTNAAVTGAESQRRSQEFTGQQNQLNRDNAVRLKAMKGAGGGKKDDRADARLDLQTEAGARQLAKDVLQSYGFKETQAQNRKFNDMASQVSSNPNAALDAVTAGSFVKMAQGGTGVISDSDMEQFWNRIGGVEDRSSQWVSNVMSGKISPEKRQKVAEAVQWLAAQAGRNLTEIQGAMDYAFKNSKNFSSYNQQMTGTYFPGSRKQEAQPGAAAAGAPKEGETRTLKSGRKVVFRGGKFVAE